MARIFITGSAHGLGQMAANLLIGQGHQVVLHARNTERGRQALEKLPGAEKVLIGDLSSFGETKKLADDVNALGRFDAIIHNAGVYRASDKIIFSVNTMAPYILTCLIQKPERLIYLGSGLHLQGDPSLADSSFNLRRTSYSDSKMHVLILSMAVARKWPEVFANTVDPGWVRTKMGGFFAPGSIQQGSETQAWLAVSDEAEAKVSGRYFYHKKERYYRKESDKPEVQENLLALCEKVSGIRFPG